MHSPIQLSTAQHNGNFMYIVGGQRRGSYSRHVLGSIWGFGQVGCPGQERRLEQSIQFILFSLSLDTSMSSLPLQVPTPLCPARSNFSLLFFSKTPSSCPLNKVAWVEEISEGGDPSLG